MPSNYMYYFMYGDSHIKISTCTRACDDLRPKHLSSSKVHVVSLHGNMEKTVDLFATLSGTQLRPILYVGLGMSGSILSSN